jgi:hypothetical protein
MMMTAKYGEHVEMIGLAQKKCRNLHIVIIT